MAPPAGTRARLLAHHLYDFAECGHRIALDATLERGRRAPPDEAMELLFAHGQRFERQVVEPLGYPAVEAEHGDEEAFARTVALMREGVAGIDQGVLLDGSRFARPDLLERAEGASRLGEFHYVPGDVKSARTSRSDAVLQVGFAAVLLESIQGRRPVEGFLILGDGHRERIDLAAIRFTVDDAIDRAEEIARGEGGTSPYFSPACARCRWRGECLPALESSRDLSFVHGMTRARRRALIRGGVVTIDDLADADVAGLASRGVPPEGLVRMQAQARTLLDGRALRRPVGGFPRGKRRELFLRIETDPLDRGEPFSIARGEAGDRRELEAVDVAIVSSASERTAAVHELLAWLEADGVRDEPIFVFGGSTPAALDALAEANGVDPARAGQVLGRIVDLAPWVRRAAVLPVFQYRFDEVAAVVRGRARPAAGHADDALLVLHAGLVAADDPDRIVGALEQAGRDALESLRAIRAWIGS